MDKLPEGFILPAELLGLSEIEVISVKLTREGSFIVFVKSTRQEILCKKCHEPTTPHGNGHRLKLPHLPILGREVYIEIQLPPLCASKVETKNHLNRKNYRAVR